MTFRFIYILLSFFLCVLISICNIHSLILFTTYPFLKLFNKKFIVTHVTDLLDMIWILVCSTSFFCTLPIFYYQLIKFFSSGWYQFQIRLSAILFYLIFFILVFVPILCYSIIMPTTLNFLIYWKKIEQIHLILMIEVEFRILNFIQWFLSFQYSCIFLIFVYIVLITTFWLFYKTEGIYILIKSYRKQLSFFNLVVLFTLSPSDISLQFFFIFFVIIIYEIVFLFVCYKISNTNHNAYNKSIIKKS